MSGVAQHSHAYDCMCVAELKDMFGISVWQVNKSVQISVEE